LALDRSTNPAASCDKTKSGKTDAQRLGEAGLLIGSVAGVVLTVHSILTHQPTKGIEYLERYIFWPVVLFLVASFLALGIRVLHLAIFREWLSPLSESSFREKSIGTRKRSKYAYIFVLFVAGSVGAYFATTNFLMLITGQIFVVLQNR